MAWLCATAAWVLRVSRRGGCGASRARGSGEAEVDGAVGDVKDDRRRKTTVNEWDAAERGRKRRPERIRKPLGSLLSRELFLDGYQSFPSARIRSLAYNLALSELNSCFTSTGKVSTETIFQLRHL